MVETLDRPSTLSKNEDRTAQLLQGVLIELIQLRLQVKQAHWNVRGPLFAPVHKFLDELAESYAAYSDEVAERMLAFDKPADGRVTRLAQDSQLEEISADRMADEEVLEFINGQLNQVISLARDAQEELAELDAVSEDLILDLLATLEKQAWMIRSQLAD